MLKFENLLERDFTFEDVGDKLIELAQAALKRAEQSVCGTIKSSTDLLRKRLDFDSRPSRAWGHHTNEAHD